MPIENYMIPCPSKTLFGIECLGCGLQRAILLLLQGEFRAAFLMYPGIYSLIFFLASLMILYRTKKTTFSQNAWKVALVVHLFFVIGGYFYKHC